MLQSNEARLERWERKVEWPLTALAVLFLVAYAWQVFDDHGSMHVALEVVLWLVWALFAVDYATRFSLARDKIQFLRTHLFDLAAVLLPMVRQLRVLRLITVITLLNKKFQHKFGSGSAFMLPA